MPPSGSPMARRRRRITKLLASLSALVTAGRFLWTASDEGRTIECLEPTKDGFRLRKQIPLRQLFANLPGEKDADEADLESLDVANGKLWISGSHCRVRKQPKKAPYARSPPERSYQPPPSGLGNAPTRKVIRLVDPVTALPFEGARSLRGVLRRNEYIEPFIDLPSKENGLDIEGICVGKTKALPRPSRATRGQHCDHHRSRHRASNGDCHSKDHDPPCRSRRLGCARSHPHRTARLWCWQDRSVPPMSPSGSIAGHRDTPSAFKALSPCSSGRGTMRRRRGFALLIEMANPASGSSTTLPTPRASREAVTAPTGSPRTTFTNARLGRRNCRLVRRRYGR